MLSFFRFLARHTAYLFFLLYCGISILLMQLQRKETLEAIRTQGLTVNASVAERLSSIGGLFALQEYNEHLLLQNARLFSRVMRQETVLRDARDRNILTAKDSTRAYGRFFVARIVDRRFSLTDNMLVINAGWRQGIDKDMAVLTPDGLVGRVTRVSENYAKVMPVINKRFKVSVVSDSSSTYGVLSWNRGSETVAHMENVPASSHLKVGERITTSDHSTFAIRGIPIGRVIRISGNKLFSDIDVRLFVDYSSLSYVLVSPDKPSAEKLEIISEEDVKTKSDMKPLGR
ncbi:MAG: rod shape-determining protein MreC [Chlorobiaceae bacterium]|nr:rod shape-determining protein MreC [Chlorobiaceae bacterium]NTW74478.1 rod shape-determining protein MreC [Chlorobiaceae bacterium]